MHPANFPLNFYFFYFQNIFKSFLSCWDTFSSPNPGSPTNSYFHKRLTNRQNLNKSLPKSTLIWKNWPLTLAETMSNPDQELNWFLKAFLKVSLGPYQANFFLWNGHFLAQKVDYCVFEFGPNREKTRVQIWSILMTNTLTFLSQILGTNTYTLWVSGSLFLWGFSTLLLFLCTSES